MAARKKVQPPNTVEIPKALYDEWITARQNEKDWAEIAGSRRSEIESRMGENEIAVLPDGTPVISWKHGKAMRLVQSRLPADIKAEYSELQPTRTFKEI